MITFPLKLRLSSAGLLIAVILPKNACMGHVRLIIKKVVWWCTTLVHAWDWVTLSSFTTRELILCHLPRFGNWDFRINGSMTMTYSLDISMHLSCIRKASMPFWKIVCFSSSHLWNAGKPIARSFTKENPWHILSS